ncbi:MAG: molybdopterin-dependent oxidoreductase [Ktedonobacteraceae bacterium]
MVSEQFRWIGKSLPRIEDERLMRGAARYIDDLEPFPGCKVAAFVRSPYAHAHIRHIDVQAALQVPGVVGVITGADVRREMRPFPVGVSAPIEYYPLAINKVRFAGEPVAVVVADSRYIAEDAAELVHVEYDPLPAVMGVEAALQPQSSVLHENVGSNIANHRIFSYGAWEQPLKDAPHVISARFAFPKTNATPIETYGVIANYTPGANEYTVWANFHGPFTLHTVMAQALKIGTQQLRLCVPADIGGSYGSKSAIYPYITLIALASKLLECPVRWIEDRMEHLKASSSGTDRVSYLTGALDESGRVLAMKLTQYDDVGAYIRAPEPATLYRTHGDTTGAYDIPALYMDNYAIMTNRLPTGLIRGYGGPQLYFTLERFMDIAAHRLGLDPAEIRQRNFIRADQFPYRTLTGGLYDSGNYEAVLDKALELSDYRAFREEQQRSRNGTGQVPLLGIGMAAVVEPSGSNMGYLGVAFTPEERARQLPKSGCTAAATVAIDALGGITARIDTTPEGQGHETVVQQIVAEVLDVEPRSIRVIAEMDTATSPWSVASGSYSSRFAPVGSSAVYTAAMRVRSKLLHLAAEQLHIPEAALRLQAGRVYAGDKDTGLSIRRLAGWTHWSPTELPGGVEPGVYETSYFSIPTVTPPNEKDQVNSSATYGFLVDIVKIQIDPETAEIKVLDYITVHDAGRLLNPRLAHGQILGGLAQGLGSALFEEMVYDEEGQLLNGSFMDYLCPTAGEMPAVKIAHLGTPSPLTPLGAKGLGEGNTMSAGAAIANAVADALGVEPGVLPLSPTRVWDLLCQRNAPDVLSKREEPHETIRI